MALLRMSLVPLLNHCLGERLFGSMRTEEHEDHAFLYVAVMWKESSRSELVQEFHGKSG